MSRSIKAALLSASLLAALPVFAADIDPARAAQIQSDKEKALADVQKKYGNKKPSELSNDERRQMAKDQAEAEQKALQKNGVSAKEWSRYEATQSRTDRAATEAAKADLKKKEEASAKAAAAKKSEGNGQQIEIQRGFGKDGPPEEVVKTTGKKH